MKASPLSSKNHPVTIKRRVQPFAMVPKAMLDNASLSWKAKGILAYLLGKPDDWQAQIKDIEKHGTDGTDAVRSAIKELREAGYAKLEQVRSKAGKILGWTLAIYDTPQPQNEAPKVPDREKPDVEKPDVVQPDVGNPYLTNTELTKTESTKNDVTTPPPAGGGGDAGSQEQLFKERHREFTALWCQEYQQVFGVPYRHGGPKDGMAIKRLVRNSSLTPEQLMQVARVAWQFRTRLFNCKHSVSLTGFDSRFNEIRAEVLDKLPRQESQVVAGPQDF